MKRFIQNILVFTVVILLIAVIADIMISNGLKRTERGHFYTMNTLMNHEINADLVILGNSRAACSYHTAILDSILKIDTRNLGVSGQPFGISYLRWCLYRRNNPNPKLLLINIDYIELDMVTNGFEKEQYYPYSYMFDSLVQPYLDLYGFSWEEKHIPMYRYRGNYKLMGIGLMELLHIHHDTKGNYIKGYSNSNRKWNGANLEKVIKDGNVKCHANAQAIALLEDLLKKARQEDLKVVFVYAPIYSKLKAYLDEEQSMAIYQDMAKRYDIPILDFSNIEICDNTDFFKNSNHVNAKGAEYFSKELAHCIDSLGLLRK